MELEKYFIMLLANKNVMHFEKPIERTKIIEFENLNKISFPESYKNLLFLFNGGEIFIPGTKIFGITDEEEYSVKFNNGKKTRSNFNIPNNYLIIAQLNFGDFICIDLNYPNRIIQWDHEEDVEFDEWNSLEEWLSEQIRDYMNNLEEEKW